MKRYEIEEVVIVGDYNYNIDIEESPIGAWCRWEDVEPLLAQIKDMQSDLDWIHDKMDF
jgi:hypothetical protein